jgi:hypothetical protein
VNILTHPLSEADAIKPPNGGEHWQLNNSGEWLLLLLCIFSDEILITFYIRRIDPEKRPGLPSVAEIHGLDACKYKNIMMSTPDVVTLSPPLLSWVLDSASSLFFRF